MSNLQRSCKIIY